MSASLKRKLGSTARSISPPATRRKVSSSVNAGETQKRGANSTGTTQTSGFTVFSWNVNGVGPLLQSPLSFGGASEGPLRTFLRRHNWPSLLCLQEVKISPKDTATQGALNRAANIGVQHGGDAEREPTYKVHFSLPRDKFNVKGFGGKVHGVATFVRHDLVTSGKHVSTASVDWDLEGRVLVTKTSGHLAVINGYWVNGTDNPYRDPTTGKVSGTRHDHKLRFHAHMLTEARTLESQGYHVVLVGDMNIAPAQIDGHPNLRTSPVQHVKNRADFDAKFLGKSGWGVDVFRALHGDKRKYTYHPRRGIWGESCDRVDLVIAGKDLMQTGAVTTGIEDNQKERGHSDHVPLWVSLDLSRLERVTLDGA